MNFLKRVAKYFSIGEWLLWSGSVSLVTVAFVLFDGDNVLTFVASLVGVTSLVFNAKGNPLGQLLMVVFGVLYGIVSFTFRYYGEMITYLGMTVPMSIFALITWLKNPYNGNKCQVAVNNSMAKGEFAFMCGLTAAVTAVFYFVLDAFDTPNIVPSTVSVATSFVAVYLTFRRSPYYAVGYAANDVVLVVLWVLAAKQDVAYVSVVVCFAVFLVNDLYGFVSWLAMAKSQRQNTTLVEQ